MKRILITGATGFLGSHVVSELLRLDGIQLYAIGGRPEDKAARLPIHPRLSVYSLESLFTEKWDNIDTVINCAFTRSNETRQLAEAIDFTEKEINSLEKMRVKSVINVSSQGVYQRLSVGELSSEDSPIEPIDLYSLAKYGCEKLFSISSIPFVTNVRLASLYMPQRFLHFFIQKAIKGECFTVSSPNQYASLLDVTDAASGLVAIVRMAPEHRAGVYNLGTGVQYSLLEYAETVKEVGEGLGYHVLYDVDDNGSTLCAGMDCSRLMRDTGWKPVILKNDMVLKLFNDLAS